MEQYSTGSLVFHSSIYFRAMIGGFVQRWWGFIVLMLFMGPVASLAQRAGQGKEPAYFQGWYAVKLRQQVATLPPPDRFPKDLPELEASLKALGLVQTVPLFQQAFRTADGGKPGPNIKRMLEAGLQRWYKIFLQSSLPSEKMLHLLQQIPEIAIAEPMAQYHQTDLPNDPEFDRQWYLRNTGQSGGTAGVDLGMETAWAIETGKPNVLVSIHDGGVDTAHPDLKQNLSATVGFNFVQPNNKLDVDGHATHVAGVLAAVRNNGIGIAGIAGGDGSPASGIRFMSLQIVGGGVGAPGSEAEAFVFAANKGAAISQNSWTYSAPQVFPQYTREAIDYFIANGGGTVMLGGLVVAAMGNASTNQPYFPAAYEPVLAVAATSHTDRVAFYSNYGPWVDVCAPGGDQSTGQGEAAGIRSTDAPQPYAFRQGTSMACPQVSALAALLLSKAPNRLLPDDLKFLIVSNCINIYSLNSELYTSQLGSGRIRAAEPLQQVNRLAQKPVLDTIRQFRSQAAADCGSVDLSWVTPNPEATVVVAQSETGNFGTPLGFFPLVGQQMPGGGQILFVGKASSFRTAYAIDSTTMRFRIWQFTPADTNYSVGSSVSFRVPFTVVNARATPSTNSISLQWSRQCPLNGVLLAVNESPFFGKPAGPPDQITSISGGGRFLQAGNQTSFIHQNLDADKGYYYAFYPYRLQNGIYEYADPQILATSTLCGSNVLPVQESFVQGNMPPAGWRLTDGGPNGALTPDGKSWRVLTGWSSDGDNQTAVMPAYVENGANSKEVLRSPAFVWPTAADSIILTFDYAYRAYSEAPNLADSLEVLLSTDCGVTTASLWKAGGTGLSTVPGVQTNEFLPDANSWKTLRLDLTNQIPTTGTAVVLFRGTNKFGQNLWLDNIRIVGKQKGFEDISASITPLSSYSCSNNQQVNITLKNEGTLSVDSLSLRLEQFGSGENISLTNLQLQPGQATTLSRTVATRPDSAFARVYRLRPDAVPANDTASTPLLQAGSATLPYHESFTDATGSLPSGWLSLGGAAKQWSIQPVAGGTMRFANALQPEQTATLISPLFTASSQADSLVLQFRLAATRSPDSLNIWLTAGCGGRKKLIVNVLPDIFFPEKPNNIPYVPDASTQWKTYRLDLLPSLTELGGGAFQVSAEAIGKGGNHLYLDQVMLEEKQIAPYLKQRGYGIFPNPTAGDFTIWHLRPPTDLSFIRVVNQVGQTMVTLRGAQLLSQNIRLQAAAWPAGVYYIQLQYTNRMETERLIRLE